MNAVWPAYSEQTTSASAYAAQEWFIVQEASKTDTAKAANAKERNFFMSLPKIAMVCKRISAPNVSL